MDIMELGAIGELVGGVAVIGSLLYVGIQIRQNTRVVQSTAHHQMLDYTSTISALLIGNPEVADLIQRGREDPDALNPTEWSRFVEVAFMRFGTWEAAYMGQQNETIDQSLWEAWDATCRYLTAGRGYMRFWSEAREGHAPAFREYVETAVFPSAAGHTVEA